MTLNCILHHPPHLGHISSMMLTHCKEGSLQYSKSCVTQVLCSIYCCTINTGRVQASLLCGASSRWTRPAVIGFLFFWRFTCGERPVGLEPLPVCVVRYFPSVLWCCWLGLL